MNRVSRSRWYGLPLLSLLLICSAPGSGRAEELRVPELILPDDVPASLRSDLELTSQFMQPNRQAMAGHLALSRAQSSDLANIHLLLNNYAYYDPLVTYRTDVLDVTAIEIDPGPRYQLATYRLLGLPEGLKFHNPPLGKPALAAQLVESEANNLTALAEAGYALSHYTSRSYVVNHDARTLSAELTVEAGPQLQFGTLTFTGLERTNQRYLQRLVPWQQGQLYAPSVAENYRQTLLASNLFSTVRVKPAATSPDGRTLPVEIEVNERPHRTIGGSLGYDSDRGPGGEAFWQHRNVWGNAEQLELKAQYYTEQQSLSASLRAPNWPNRKTTVFANIELLNEQTDAYNESGIVTEIGAEHQLTPLWSISAGTRLRFSSVNDELVSNLAFPLTLTADASDSKLSPTRGWRSSTTLTPVIALSGEQAAYATWQQRLSGYIPLNHKRSVVFAGWGRIGGVLAAKANDIAPTSRFYAGGGGSVRGYAFRSIGKRDASGDPLGGSALAEGGVELRFPIHDNISGVVFAEAGSVSDSTLPTFTDTQYAAGLGVRYTTSFAPLRFDVAVPLNPRNDDDRYQVYISIGQAF